MKLTKSISTNVSIIFLNLNKIEKNSSIISFVLFNNNVLPYLNLNNTEKKKFSISMCVLLIQ